MAQSVGRGIALVSMTTALEGNEWSAARPRPYFTARKDPLHILQEAGWAPGPVGGKYRPTGIRSPDRPARSQSLYRLSYPAHYRTVL